MRLIEDPFGQKLYTELLKVIGITEKEAKEHIKTILKELKEKK